MRTFKMWLMLTVVMSSIATISAIMSCDDFKKFIDNVYAKDSTLENMGSQAPDDVFGANPTYTRCSAASKKNAELHTHAAQLYTDKYGSMADFSALVSKCGIRSTPVPRKCTRRPRKLPRYRTIDGRGYNVFNAEFGASDTPFRRFADTGYKDSVYTPRQSMMGGPLPNTRELVQNVLKKCKRTMAISPVTYSVFALMTVLFITHDAHYQTAIQPVDPANEFSCCTADNSDMLSDASENTHCLAISVPKNDSFYSAGNIGCISMVRSQTGEYTGKVRATSYLDLSLIYGNHKSELDQIRTFSNGLLRMGRGGILPVDQNGEYIPSMLRFTNAPFAAVWPSSFARNHNTLAKGLKKDHPGWSDEILFQEARRINIAIFQYNLITSKAVEYSISGISSMGKYYPDRNAAVSLEFSIGYRGPHYYLRDEMTFVDANNNTNTWLQSDTIGQIEILEDNFEDAIRGASLQTVNADGYGDEITNRIGKDADGYGKDVISIDIQRSRDQGTPTYLAVRRKCNLKPEVKCFDDLNDVLNPANVAVLRAAYKHVEDIDYYVAGTMEMFDKLGNPLVGPTFGCVSADQWNHFAGGDIYYYLNQKSPHPFNQEQIWAIGNYSISNLVCANTNIELTPAGWPYAPSKANPLVPCTTFPAFNFTAFKAVKFQKN